jgi:hypothetical protein
MARIRPLIMAAALAVASAGPLLGREPARQASPSPPGPLQIQITSPLGRTGVAGAVRVVARVVAPPSASLSPVQFFIDGKLLGEDKDGPPYAVEWKDDNPFEARQIDRLGGFGWRLVVVETQDLECRSCGAIDNRFRITGKTSA